MSSVLPSRTLWRGNPPSDDHQPDPVEIVRWAEWVEASLVAGINRLANADLATTGSVTLSGEQTIDGTLTSASRVLVKNQAVASQNGIYITASGAWSRATDADADAEIANAFVYVEGGSANAGKAYALAGAPQLGVDAVVFTQVALSGEVTAEALGAVIAGGIPKSEPVDDDELPISDSEAAGASKKISWADIKAALRSLRDSDESPLIDAVYRSILAGDSDTGNVAIATLQNGGIQLAETRHEPLLSPDFVEVVSSYDGDVISAIGFDGVDMISASFKAFAAGAGPHAHVYAGGLLSQVTGGARTWLHAQVQDGQFSAIDVNGVEVTTPIWGDTTAIGDAVTKIIHVPGYGQSQMTGAANAEVLTPTAVRAGRAIMFNGGARVSGTQQISGGHVGFPAENMRDFVDAREALWANTGETSTSSMLYELTDASGFASSEAALGSIFAWGSASYSSLAAPGDMWSGLEDGIWRARLLSALRGYEYEIPALAWDQGEGNVTDAAGVYLGHLTELQSDFEGLVGEVNALPASGIVPIVYSQLSSFPYYSAQPNVALDQLAAAISDPTRFLCIGPKYQYDYTANGHLVAAAQVTQGAMMARAILANRVSAGSWLPLHATSATRSGAVVTVQFNVPSGILTLDTTNVTDPGDYGITWEDAGDGNAVTVSSVFVVSNTEIEVTLSDVPTGTAQKIGVALEATPGAASGPTSGARCCLRDSSSDTDKEGTPMWNWACHQRIAVTV